MFKNYKAFVIFSAIYAVFTFTACNISPVEVKQMDNIAVKNIDNNKILLEVTATVYNPNRTIKIKDSQLFLFLNNSEIGKISQVDNILFQGKSTGTYTTRVNLELTNLPGGMKSAYKLLGSSKKDLKINGTVKVSATLFCKTIKIKDYQVFK